MPAIVWDVLGDYGAKHPTHPHAHHGDALAGPLPGLR